MADKRDRILNLKTYLEQAGIIVNIGKNKARGNKGIFVTRDKKFRIDISKNLDEEHSLSTLVHEYAHYIHYKYDKTLQSYQFIFPDFNDTIHEELLCVSVNMVPKETAIKLFEEKQNIENSIHNLSKNLKNFYPDFKLSKPCIQIEKTISFPFTYLLKYDRVKIFNKVYNIQDSEICNFTPAQKLYVDLKSKQRLLKRINSKIVKLNNYYNKPTELIARFIEMYFTNYSLAYKYAPNCCEALNIKINENIIPELVKLKEIFFL